jgi:short-subunit dehydrogenase
MQAIVITGAGSGLGKELALLFSKNNYQTILIGRSSDKLEGVSEEIRSFGGHSKVIQADIRSFSEVEAKFKELNGLYDIQGVINNAGVGFFGPFRQIAESEIQEMVETNILGTIYVTKAILPLLERKSSGFVMNIISTAGLRGKVNEAVYVASKFAVRGFTESLQKEYEQSNLTFKAVYMGGMDTPFWENSDHIKDPSRLRSPKEIADIIFTNINNDTIIIENQT